MRKIQFMYKQNKCKSLPKKMQVIYQRKCESSIKKRMSSHKKMEVIDKKCKSQTNKRNMLIILPAVYRELFSAYLKNRISFPAYSSSPKKSPKVMKPVFKSLKLWLSRSISLLGPFLNNFTQFIWINYIAVAVV